MNIRLYYDSKYAFLTYSPYNIALEILKSTPRKQSPQLRISDLWNAKTNQWKVNYSIKLPI